MSVSQDIQRHFEEFISKKPTAEYEEWISALHPEETSDGLLGLGDVVIPPKFYQEGNEHLKFWNDHLDSKRTRVPVSSPNDSAVTCHDESFAGFDLLSGEGETDSQASPQLAPRTTVKVAPGEDLLKFD